MNKTNFFKVMFFAAIVALAACSNVNEPEPEPEPKVEIGDGTKAKPYTVTEVIALNPQSTTEAVKTAVWIKGYIVGYYNSTLNPAVVEAVAPFTDDVNVMIAEKASETDKSKMVSVQLPSGAVRTALGLKTTPANFGKLILLYGDIMKYNTYPGLKNTVGYWFVETNTGLEPVDNSNAIFSETFAVSQGSFTIKDVTLPDGGTFVWKWDTNKYIKASAFIGGSAKASECWLISPAINLTGKSSAMLSFEHTGKYFTANKLTEQVLLVSTDYTAGLPSTATWTTITIPTWPSGSDWTFVNSGDISLSTVLGQANVRIAFKFTSTTAGSATWEIKNVLVK